MSRQLVAALARCLLLAGGGLFFTSCGGGGSPTMAAAVPTPPPPLNLTGTWKGTVVEICDKPDRRTFDLTMALAQAPGNTTLTGTITTQYRTSQFLDTITIGSLKDRLVELDTDANNSPSGYRYRGEVDTTGAEMNGNIAIIGYSVCATFSARR